jgi:uncharacterized protein
VPRWIRVISTLLVLPVALGAAPSPSPYPLCAPGEVSASPALVDLYFSAYDSVYKSDIIAEPDGTTYISTGDIKAEWLRDSSAVARAYIGQAKSDPAVRNTLRGVIARQAKYILIDPYANAFSANYGVVEQKFEADSLLYPVWLTYSYWRATGDLSIFTSTEAKAFDQILRVLRIEQHHTQQSHYTNPNLPNHGHGSPVAFTGMIWSGFRPSDDATTYGYLIPTNMLAVVVLRAMTLLEQRAWGNSSQAANAWGLSVQVQRGIEQHGLIDRGAAGKVYAYEVDGFGHVNMMDDANVPSLLSIPYFTYLNVDDPNYQSTRRFVLSNGNPYYFMGKYARGIGSPHTPKDYVWPLALVMQAFTSTSPAETAQVLEYIANSLVSDRRLHESFDVNDPNKFTRADFAWPNALYTELITALTPRAVVPQTPQPIECFNGVAKLPTRRL